MKMHQGQRGDTPLLVLHRQLTEYVGEQTDADKARFANDLLGTDVWHISELSIEQMSQLSMRIAEMQNS